MAASIETQRLISVSLGKIAQSRGQRGGINLHKNLLVATVLHKARTAYMMETYNYQQQQQSLQRQKLLQQEQLLLQQQQQAMQQQQQTNVQETTTVCSVSGTDSLPSSAARGHEVCEASRAGEVGHTSALSSAEAGSEESGSPISDSHAAQNETVQEPMTVQECAEAEVAAACASVDKENSPPPVSETPHPVSETSDASQSQRNGNDHVAAATKLSLEVQQFGLGAAQDNTSFSSSCQKQQQSSTSGAPTCNGILKRRRDNFNTLTSDSECPASKKARVSVVSNDSSSSSSLSSSHSRSLSSTSSILVSFASDMSDYSSDESDSESEAELSTMHTDSSSQQISNLVTIFNSGFSGLCASSSTDPSGQDNSYQSDYEISSSSSPQYTTLTKLRPETPTPGSYSRKMSEPSLMCSSEVGRLDSLPSAIVLSA